MNLLDIAGYQPKIKPEVLDRLHSLLIDLYSKEAPLSPEALANELDGEKKKFKHYLKHLKSEGLIQFVVNVYDEDLERTVSLEKSGKELSEVENDDLYMWIMPTDRIESFFLKK